MIIRCDGENVPPFRIGVLLTSLAPPRASLVTELLVARPTIVIKRAGGVEHVLLFDHRHHCIDLQVTTIHQISVLAL